MTAPNSHGRRIANGRRFDPRSTSVAHRTLPFGTKVLVTNLGNGRSATATVEDRGPFVQGRIIDLSPRLAAHLGMVVQGVAPVAVVPVELAEAPDSQAPQLAHDASAPERAAEGRKPTPAPLRARTFSPLTNGAVGALSRHAARAGSASALLGTVQFSLAASGSALVGARANGTPRPMALLMLLGVAGATVAELARPRR